MTMFVDIVSRCAAMTWRLRRAGGDGGGGGGGGGDGGGGDGGQISDHWEQLISLTPASVYSHTV